MTAPALSIPQMEALRLMIDDMQDGRLSEEERRTAREDAADLLNLPTMSEAAVLAAAGERMGRAA